jgi:hypothetical protein
MNLHKLSFINLVSVLLLVFFLVPTVSAAERIAQLTIPGCSS